MLQLTNMESYTTLRNFFLSIFQCKSLGSMQILLLISRRPFYFQTFGN